MSKSTKSRRPNKSQKPAKPYPEFPLFPHATGRWAKKIRQKLVYFGKIADDPEGTAALERFNREWPYLKDGRTPPPADVGDGCTLKVLCNSFLSSKENRMNVGELSRRSFRDYYVTCESLIDHFGRHRRVDDLRPDDFEGFRAKLAKRLGAVSLGNEINRCRMVFKFAFDSELIDRPVRYGQGFDRPSARTLRKARNEAGPRMFEADELRRILDALDGKPVLKDKNTGKPIALDSNPVVRAMALLGVNCGFGDSDVARLPIAAIDFEDGWIDFPRPKTGICRRCPLWPETVEALRKAIEQRPDAKDPADSDLCFLTVQGKPWVRTQPKRADPEKFVTCNTVAANFGRLLRKLKINGRRGLGFYALRHVFQTIAGESKDPDAVSSIMGHVDSSMAAVYRERISDERLRAVVDVVRAWLLSA